MAERRSTPKAFVRAEPCLDRWLAASRPTIWMLRDRDGLVAQPFFVALDPDGLVCWTDDRSRAQRFPAKGAADRFALDRMTTDVCVVQVADPSGHFAAAPDL